MLKLATLTQIVCMLGLMVCGNLFMKLGAIGPAGSRWFFNLAGTQTIVGVSFYGMALILYAWLLKTVPLNVMQSLTAIQFIAVILASAAILAEPISGLRWAGIALIACGMLIVGISISQQGEL